MGELDPAGELGSDESDSSEDLEALDAAANEYSKEVESELLRTVPRRSGETEYELLLRAGFFHDSPDGISPGWFDSAALGYADTWKGGRVFVFPSRAFRTGVAWRRLVREADRRAGGPTLELRLRARQAARALGRARAERAAPLRAPPVGQLRDEEARRLEAAVTLASEVWAAAVRRLDRAEQEAVAAGRTEDAAAEAAGGPASGGRARGRGRGRGGGGGRGGGAGGGRRGAP